MAQFNFATLNIHSKTLFQKNLSAPWSHQVPVNFVPQNTRYQKPDEFLSLCSDLPKLFCTASMLKQVSWKA